MNRFFWLILIILLLLVFACSSSSPNSTELDAQSPPSPVDDHPDVYHPEESDTGENIAVYLIQGTPQIPSADLAEHPEILVATTFAEFQKAASTEIQLWIDKEAVDLVDIAWLRSEPQKYYPLVLVGSNDPSRFFTEVGRHVFTGGPVILDLESNQPESGFSVDIPLQNTDYPDRPGFPAFIKGYDWTPSSQSILDIIDTVVKTKSLVIDIYERRCPENAD
ncbi:MAG: hypothetical protein R6U37_08710 [Dehalococcoidia bacterium]